MLHMLAKVLQEFKMLLANNRWPRFVFEKFQYIKISSQLLFKVFTYTSFPSFNCLHNFLESFFPKHSYFCNWIWSIFIACLDPIWPVIMRLYREYGFWRVVDAARYFTQSGLIFSAIKEPLKTSSKFYKKLHTATVTMIDRSFT